MKVLFAICVVLLAVSSLAETLLLSFVPIAGLVLLTFVALERRARRHGIPYDRPTTNLTRADSLRTSNDELDKGDHVARRRRDRQDWLLACIKEQDWLCARCKSPLPSKLSDVHLDHKTPLMHGGSSARENLQALCARCNLSKGTKAL